MNAPISEQEIQLAERLMDGGLSGEEAMMVLAGENEEGEEVL